VNDAGRPAPATPGEALAMRSGHGWLGIGLALPLGLALASSARAGGESPVLGKLVEAGKLPPLAQRLPERPRVLATDPEAVYGGDLRMLIGTLKDTKLAFVYGYARLVGWDRNFRLVSDIVERYDIEDGGRTFTFRLRKGHRWSDGAPFTSADFAYWWTNVANDDELSPGGPPATLRVDGEMPKMTFPDPLTVRLRWSKPNNLFLIDQASAYPTIIYRPAHYLKQFHKAFNSADALKKLARAEGRRNWAALHNKKDSMYLMDNPDLPTLQPWRPTVGPPAQVFVSDRNPYFHRVDERGRQLPYIDRLVMLLVERAVIPVKTSTGEADLQARYLPFDQVPFLRKNEQLAGFRVFLWNTGVPSTVAIYPNLTTNDPVMRKLFHDRRFRQALSLAVNRPEINHALYYGLGLPGQATVLRSPTGHEEPRMAYARFDLVQANRLLDEMGLTARDGRGFRLRPDGQRLDLIVETSGDETEHTDVLELVKDTWAELGVELLIRPSQLEVFRRRVFSGEAIMSAYNGNAGFGLPTPYMSPDWLAPVSQQQLQWPKWGAYFESKGRDGEAPSLPAARRLVELYERWLVSGDPEEKARVWAEMLDINAEEIFTIGIVGGTLQPIVVKNGLRGVPTKGIYSWEPGSHFGIYNPDTFYWQGGHR
jgi:peptide/nickel transport system substrate-binding protein